MAATSAVCLITSASHGGTALGFVQAWDVTYTPTDSEVVGEGATGTQALAPIHETVEVVLSFLVAPVIAPSTAVATMVLVGKDHAGAAQTITITLMRPRGYANKAVVAGQAVWQQHFVYVGTFAAHPVSVS